MSQPSNNRIADGLYHEFMNTLQLLESTGDKRVLRMWQEDLEDLHLKAQQMLETGDLNLHSLNKLKILCRTPVAQWITKARTKNVPLKNAM